MAAGIAEPGTTAKSGRAGDVDAGITGTAGGDCTPGTPGKENKSLKDGRDDAAPGYIAFSTAEEEVGRPISSAGAESAGSGADFESRKRAGTALPLGSANEGDEDGANEGDEGGDVTVGIVCTPDTFGIAGVRGNENNSFIGGNTAAAAGVTLLSPSARVAVEPVAPGAAATPPNEVGTALASAPPGGAVGAEEGIPAIPGNENISFPSGSEGPTANGEIVPSP